MLYKVMCICPSQSPRSSHPFPSLVSICLFSMYLRRVLKVCAYLWVPHEPCGVAGRPSITCPSRGPTEVWDAVLLFVSTSCKHRQLKRVIKPRHPSFYILRPWILTFPGESYFGSLAAEIMRWVVSYYFEG